MFKLCDFYIHELVLNFFMEWSYTLTSSLISSSVTVPPPGFVWIGITKKSFKLWLFTLKHGSFRITSMDWPWWKIDQQKVHVQTYLHYLYNWRILWAQFYFDSRQNHIALLNVIYLIKGSSNGHLNGYNPHITNIDAIYGALFA